MPHPRRASLLVLSTSASDVGDFIATANANLAVVSETPPTVYLDWGESADALNTTTNLGVFSEAGPIATVLDDLTPATTYYYRHRADDGGNVSNIPGDHRLHDDRRRLVQRACGFEHPLDGVPLRFARRPRRGADHRLALVRAIRRRVVARHDLGSGFDADELLVTIRTARWAPPTTTPSRPNTNTVATPTRSGQRPTPLLINVDVVWTGGGSDTAWGTGANWDLGMAPLAVSTATINQGASVSATGNGVANVLQVNAAAPVSIDFTGHSLAVPTVHIGTNSIQPCHDGQLQRG